MFFYYLEKTIFSALFVMWAILSYDPTDLLLLTWEVPAWVNMLITFGLVIVGPIVIFKNKPEREM